MGGKCTSPIPDLDIKTDVRIDDNECCDDLSCPCSSTCCVVIKREKKKGKLIKPKVIKRIKRM